MLRIRNDEVSTCMFLYYKINDRVVSTALYELEVGYKEMS